MGRTAGTIGRELWCSTAIHVIASVKMGVQSRRCLQAIVSGVNGYRGELTQGMPMTLKRGF